MRKSKIPEPMRLQRFLAQAGLASRRHAETMITSGRVKVNGATVTELGTKVRPGLDKVVVDGNRLEVENHVYLLLYKPRGYMTTVSDPEGRPTVMDLLPPLDVRVYPVGRLDYNTEGLLVLTNDGDLANSLMHPRGEIGKTYRVKVRGLVGDDVAKRLSAGVTLDDGDKTAPAEVGIVGGTERNSWLEITIREGKNRQVHRMMEAVGYDVVKLQRTGYGGLEVGDMRPGQVRGLTEQELWTLQALASGKKLPAKEKEAAREAPPKHQSRTERKAQAPRVFDATRAGRPGDKPRAGRPGDKPRYGQARSEGRPESKREPQPPRGYGRPDAKPPAPRGFGRGRPDASGPRRAPKSRR